MATSDSNTSDERTEKAKLDQSNQVNDTNKKNGSLSDGKQPSWADRYLSFIWMGIAFAAMFTIMFLPPFEGVSVAGQRALAILVFAVIMWMTEAVSYPISSVMILVLIALSIGFSPDPDSPGEILGTSGGLSAALSGFATSAVALVAAALALAAAMQATGLHKRLAFHILRFSGEKVSNIIIGAILIATVLAFFVPSATARAGAVVPILLGMILAFGMPLNSKLGALLIITAAQAISIWNVGIKTAAAQNLVADGFILEMFGESISWPRWFMIGAPWSILMSIVLYFVMRWTIKPETRVLPGGKEVVQEGLAKLGPISPKEIRLAVLAAVMLLLWSTEGILHPLDSSTITVAGIALMLIPKIGVLDWEQLESMVNWGTLVVFAIGISLGTLLLNSGAAEWLSAITFESMGLSNMPLLATIAIVSVFNIVIHLGFASATALSSALIPVFIVLAMSIPGLPDQGVGFVIIQQFVICFGFILPISAPQNMLAYGTGTFTVKQFIRVGIPLTVVGYLLVLLLSATYWKWIGVL